MTGIPTDLDGYAETITEHLTTVWGWLPDEPEAVQLGRQLAPLLVQAVEGTSTHPGSLLNALMHDFYTPPVFTLNPSPTERAEVRAFLATYEKEQA